MNQKEAALRGEVEAVSNILEKAVHVLMDVEVLPHAVFQTDIAENHLELAEVSLDAIRGSQEGASKDLVGAGDVSEEGDEGARQVADVVLTKRTATHRTRFFPKPSIGDNLLLALLAEDVA